MTVKHENLVNEKQKAQDEEMISRWLHLRVFV